MLFRSALPAGKSLDVNFIHNYAKRRQPGMAVDGFSRNEGVGSWELNLAAFFRDLNTNVWNSASYAYNPNTGVSSSGLAFGTANLVLSNRYGGNYTNLATMSGYYGPAAATFASDGINSYSDAPLAVGSVDPDQNKLGLPWSGSDSKIGRAHV